MPPYGYSKTPKSLVAPAYHPNFSPPKNYRNMKPEKLQKKLELKTLAAELRPLLEAQKELFVRVLDVAYVHFVRIAAAKTWLGAYTTKRIAKLLCTLIDKAKSVVENL